MNGSPTAIEHGAKLPGFQNCVPYTPTGTTGTFSWIATIAAPGCAVPGTPLRCRVPSTKSPTARPSRAACRISRTASRSDSPRRTASVPCLRITQPSPGA